MSQEIWESWQKAWEDPAFKRKREIFAQNRRSETGRDGAGPSRHTGGSISVIETARLLAEKLGREPTPIEVFTYTHTKDHDLNTFVDRCARQIAELRAHVMRLSGEPGVGTSSPDPAPATDRNVLTSQQQPLPAADPDAADDTLVTPPGATSHPAGTPPGEPTTDPPDEQQRRFDFGPF
ncbi:hypothetical protein JCGZ_10007 [Jatropha curcas]|uniref:Uncharacterized protein n=1 Tax=Jatropha curcas TaxID=180498 RepID=A0A067KII2_JATCU|nr:hypothetical protein JCGZ_10007 [Jatropha curcas]